MSRGVYAVVVALVGSLAGCSGGGSGEPTTPATAATTVDRNISGVWRLTNYIPDKELDPSLLLSMQSEKIMVRFQDGVVSSVTSSLLFERRYRIADVNGDTFHLFVEDTGGIEYESVCQLDNLGSMSCRTLTEPWTGRGVLTREGPAIERQ